MPRDAVMHRDVTSQCGLCTRFRVDSEDRFVCDAFPSGIPEAIFGNRFDHRDAYVGDNGLRFDPFPFVEPDRLDSLIVPGEETESDALNDATYDPVEEALRGV